MKNILPYDSFLLVRFRQFCLIIFLLFSFNSFGQSKKQQIAMLGDSLDSIKLVTYNYSKQIDSLQNELKTTDKNNKDLEQQNTILNNQLYFVKSELEENKITLKDALYQLNNLDFVMLGLNINKLYIEANYRIKSKDSYYGFQIFVKYYGKRDLVRVYNDNYSREDIETTYIILLDTNDDMYKGNNKIQLISEIPHSVTGDWYAEKHYYFDTIGKTFAINTIFNTFNSECASITYQDVIKYYNNFFFLINTDEKIKLRHPYEGSTECSLNYWDKKEHIRDVNQYLRENHIKIEY